MFMSNGVSEWDDDDDGLGLYTAINPRAVVLQRYIVPSAMGMYEA